MAVGQPDIHIKGIGRPHVTVAAAKSGEFNSAISRMLQGRVRADVQPMLPYSLVITNTTSKKAVAYMVNWVIFDAFGKQTQRHIRLSTTFRGDPPISQNGAVLVTPYHAISAYLPAQDVPTNKTIAKAQQLSGASRITITLDAVAFEDGQVIGQDKLGTARQLNSQSRAQREVMSSLMNYVRVGSGIRSITDWLTIIATTKMPAAQTFEEVDWYGEYTKNLAHDLLNIARVGGEQALVKYATTVLDGTVITFSNR